MRTDFWGEVYLSHAGVTSERTFSCYLFDGQSEIFLGEQFDEDGEEIEALPTEEQLYQFQNSFENFLTDLDSVMLKLRESAFQRYQDVYAHYYESPEKSGEPALNIDQLEKHDQYIRRLLYVRVYANHTLRLAIRYGLDNEHGIEFKIVNGEIEAVGGIAET